MFLLLSDQHTWLCSSCGYVGIVDMYGVHIPHLFNNYMHMEQRRQLSVEENRYIIPFFGHRAPQRCKARNNCHVSAKQMVPPGHTSDIFCAWCRRLVPSIAGTTQLSYKSIAHGALGHGANGAFWPEHMLAQANSETDQGVPTDFCTDA